MSVTKLIEESTGAEGRNVKIEATVHAISSVKSTQHPEPKWDLQLVDDDDDYRQHKAHTLTCSVGAKPEGLQLRDLVVVEGTAQVSPSGRVLLKGCTIRSSSRLGDE